MESLLILGRQPALGMAELESLYGSAAVRGVGTKAAIVEVDPCLLAFDRLGGSIKFCKVLATLDTTKWDDIERFLIKVSPEHSKSMPDGKMLLGLSLYGFSETVPRITSTGLNLKKAIRKTGRSVRLIPNKTPELNSAQVIYNKLTTQNGWELVFVSDNHKTVIGQTVKVQDITSYASRDQQRPKRDSKVGMLPPKLAQIIINMASGLVPEESRQSICEVPDGQALPSSFIPGQVILDPFCGSGVILQEAALMGYEIYGSDIDSRMVEYTEKNLLWLFNQPSYKRIVRKNSNEDYYKLEVADATSYKWGTFNFVASETYLGRPFTSQPSSEVLAQTLSGCNIILKKFLQNIATQIKPGTRICLAIPTWQTKQNQFQHLPLIDQITNLGYTRISFEHVRDDQLIYYRPDQIVARELLVIVRI